MGSSGIPRGWAATGRRPGVAYVPDMSDRSASTIADRVMALKGPGDIAVVSVHWGSNWGYDVDTAQIRFAHRLIDAGIDVVHGHSSHHPRPIEVYRGRLIMYGCGDTIDDYEGISTYESFRHELRLLYFASVDSESGTVLRMVPMRMRRMRLERAPDEDAEWLRATVAAMSRRFGTRVDNAADGVLTVRAALERELEMQFGQAAQDERRHVLVVTVVGGTMLVLGDPDVGGAVEKTLDADPCLGTSQWSTGARVNTSAKSDVTAGVWTRRIEGVGLVEMLRVASIAGSR